MGFRKKNFIVPLLDGDVVLKLKDEFGSVRKMMTDGYANVTVKNNYIIVKQKADTKQTELIFPTASEASEAQILLMTALKTLNDNRRVTFGGTTTAEDVLCGETRANVLRTDIWTQSDIIPTPAPNATTGVVTYVQNLVLDPQADQYAFNGASFIRPIPPTVHSSYAVVVKTSTGQIIPDGWNGIDIDYACCYVKFNSYTSSGEYIVNADEPISVTFHKYVGTLGVFDITEATTVTFFPTSDNQTVFNTNLGSVSKQDVFINGVLINEDQYQWQAGGNFEWISTDFDLETTDEIRIDYFN